MTHDVPFRGRCQPPPPALRATNRMPSKEIGFAAAPKKQPVTRRVIGSTSAAVSAKVLPSYDPAWTHPLREVFLIGGQN
jgi:hypothetical protein